MRKSAKAMLVGGEVDPLILFKMLVLQQLFNMSVGVRNDIPDATTLAFFRERLRKAGMIEGLFKKFESYLRSQGL